MIDHVTLMSMQTRPAKLSNGYKAALKALRSCARSYSPERYAAAMAALQFVIENDEVESVPNSVDAFFDYNKIAKDKALMRLSAKVDAMHGRAQVAA